MGLNGGGNADNDGAKGSLSLAIGANTEANGGSSIAMGNYSTANGVGAISIGEYSLAIGDYAISNGKASTAIGKNSLITENSEYSIALGSGAYIGKIKEVSSSAIIDSNNGGVFNRWKNGVGSNMD